MKRLLILLFAFAIPAFSQTDPAVKQAVVNVLKASDKDGIHEEAFKWGKDKDGNTLISYSRPGKTCTSVCNENFIPADPTVDNNFVTIDGFAHVHPRGDGLHAYVQPPSAADLAFATEAPAAINIVIGSESKTVYFFDGKGITGTLKLKDFLK